MLGVLRYCGVWRGLPRRVLGPAGGCNPSPRTARRRGSRYGKRVQECCFCLEPLSRSNGASKPLTQSCSLCLWSRSRAKHPCARDTVPYGGLMLAGAAGTQVAVLLPGQGCCRARGMGAGLGSGCCGSGQWGWQLWLPGLAGGMCRCPARQLGSLTLPWRPWHWCFLWRLPRPSGFLPSARAMLPCGGRRCALPNPALSHSHKMLTPSRPASPCYRALPRSCPAPRARRASDAIHTPGPALRSRVPPVPCPALWAPRREAVPVAAGCPLAPLLFSSPATFATLVHPTAAAVRPLPWPASAMLPPRLDRKSVV